MLHINNMHLLKIFEQLTNLKLNNSISDAGMPRTVCYICHQHLQKCHLFSDMAHRSDKAMRYMLHNGIELSRKHGSGSAAAIEELRRAFEHAERSAPHLTRAFVQQNGTLRCKSHPTKKNQW